MNTQFRSLTSALALVVAGAGGMLLVGPSPALSVQNASVKPARWEYTTSSVESGTLQAKLTELGNEGWDVFSIERATSQLDQTPDNKTRLVAELFQVTARRTQVSTQ